MSSPETTPKMPPVLSAEARGLLLWLAQWDRREDGLCYLQADQVPQAAELVAAGQIWLRNYKGSIEMVLVGRDC